MDNIDPVPIRCKVELNDSPNNFSARSSVQ